MEEHIASQALLKEYEVLRGEITEYHQSQDRVRNWTLGLAIATVALTADAVAAVGQATGYLSAAVLCIMGAVHHADRTLRIRRIARYLHMDLRPKVNKLTGSPMGTPVLEWENWKAKEKGTMENRRAGMADAIRSSLLSTTGGILLYCTITVPGLHNHKFLLGTTILAILLLGATIWIEHGTEETRGAARKESP